VELEVDLTFSRVLGVLFSLRLGHWSLGVYMKASIQVPVVSRNLVNAVGDRLRICRGVAPTGYVKKELSLPTHRWFHETAQLPQHFCWGLLDVLPDLCVLVEARQ